MLGFELIKKFGWLTDKYLIKFSWSPLSHKIHFDVVNQMF